MDFVNLSGEDIENVRSYREWAPAYIESEAKKQIAKKLEKNGVTIYKVTISEEEEEEIAIQAGRWTKAKNILETSSKEEE